MSDQGSGRQEGPVPTRTARGARESGTVLGVVLIVIGLIMLLGRYVTWFEAFRLWPLFIVAGGIAGVFRQQGEPLVKRVAEGAGSVVIGFVLLGNTLGYISWSVWVSILPLWPLLLVALGVELLGKGLGMPWVRALSNVVLIAGLLYGVFVLPPGSFRAGSLVPGTTIAGTAYAVSAPRDTSVREGNVSMKAAAARITVKAGTVLARLSGRSPASNTPALKTSVGAGRAEITIDQPERRGPVAGIEERTIDLELDEAVTWSALRFDVGATQADIDLRGLRVRDVSLNAGASDLVLDLGGRSDDMNVAISGGAANITIRVPARAGVAIELKSGLSSVTMPSGYHRLSGTPVLGDSSWASDTTGTPRISVAVESGVSNLTVETY